MTQKNIKIYETKKIYDIPLDLIRPDPDNPRKIIDERDLEGLITSIQKVGIKYPVIFRQDGAGLVIVDGERRYRSALAAGLKTIPGILESGDPEETAIIANIHRREYTAVAEAEALLRLKEKYNYTDQELKGIISKARSTISDILLINNLPEEIKEVCRGSHSFAQRQLIRIARIKNPKKQAEAFKKLQESVDSAGKRTRSPKKETATKSIETITDKLERLKDEWVIPEKWSKREIFSVKKELENLKTKIEELLTLTE